MEQLKLNIVIDSSLYLKDPESSKLGKKVVGKGIEMMEEMGYEFFSFMKLGDKIGSNESSIYRYFSKHLPFLTDTKSDKDTIVNFYTELIQKAKR